MKSSVQKLSLFFVFFFLLSNTIFAQLTEDKTKQIDELFLSWNSPDHPGGSVGVVMGDKLIYSKAFGLSSLEYLVPNTYATQYNIASVSKQFTAFGICLMQVRGQLSVDDDIRKYLPYMPEFEQKITIRHMLHHTSGLRSLHAMLALAGWRDDDSRTNEDLVGFMKRQKDLNFVPGSEYMYCNTGYILMAEIIEKISGEDFTVWMQNNVFEPMHMNHTYVERMYDRIVKNNATSYDMNRDGSFDRSVEYWGYVGSGNIHTNVPDLLTWLKQVRDPEPEWKDAVALMKTTDPFNDGSPNNYAFGVTVDQYKNENRISHGGSIGGFRSNVVTYPDQKLDIVILTNFSGGDPGGKTSAITDIILEKKPTEAGIRPYRMGNEQFDQIAGRYDLKSTPKKSIDIFRIGNTFYGQFSGENQLRLIPRSESTFSDATDQVTIKFIQEDQEAIIEINIKNEEKTEGIRTKEFLADPKTIESVSGTYWSPELETQYLLFMKDGELKGHHSRHGDFNIRFIRDNEFNGDPSYFNFFSVQKDRRGKVNGIYVTNSRVRNLWFEKIK